MSSRINAKKTILMDLILRQMEMEYKEEILKVVKELSYLQMEKQ